LSKLRGKLILPIRNETILWIRSMRFCHVAPAKSG